MGRDRARLLPTTDLDAYVAGLTTRVASSDSRASSASRGDGKAPRVARWVGNEKVLLLTFPDAATQRRALGRASMYIEDPDHRGRVAEALPAGARGGVANYSGHNARVRELVEFYNAARGDDGDGAWDDERAMMEALVDAGVVRKEKCGRVSVSAEWSRRNGWDGGWDGGGWDGEDAPPPTRDVVPEACVIAVCASGDAREVQDALLHEAMHGLWYARDDFARWCYDFYLGDALDDAERATWVEFLRELRYDVSVEEIVVNEFQAYMATERVLFGPDAACAGKSSSSSSKKSNAGGRRGVDALAAMQRKFCDAARDVVHDPPRCGNLTVVWIS